MIHDKTIIYHLPRSRLCISGTATTRRNLDDGNWVNTSTVEVSLDVEADPDDYFILDLEGSGLADSSFDLGLTTDGRLTSASATTTGRVGTAIQSVLGAAATVAGALGGLRGATQRRLGGRQRAIREPINYEDHHPEMASRLRTATAAAAQLANLLIEVAAKIGAENASTADRRSALGSMLDVRMALREVRSEVALLEQHKAAWRTRMVAPTTELHSFVVLLNDAPAASTVHEWIKSNTELTKELLRDMWPLYEALQVIVAIDSVRPPGFAARNAAGSEKLGSVHSGVMFRRPHPADIVVFGHKPGFDDLVALSQSTELVVDGNSPVEFLGFDKAWLGEKTLALEFSTLGSPTTISLRETTELAGAASAIGELPATVHSALTKANEIIDQQQVLERQGIEQQLLRIADERKLIEEQIANDEALAKQHLAVELARLESQRQQLQAFRDIGTLRLDMATTQQTGTNQITKQVATLQKELEQLQLDRANIRQQLAESQATSGLTIEAAVAEKVEAIASSKVDQAEMEAKLDRLAVTHRLELDQAIAKLNASIAEIRE